MDINFFEEAIQQLEDKNLRRKMRTVSGVQSREIVLDGKKVLNFCSNNYLGLADDPRLVEAAEDALKTQGFGSGASRLVCGNFDEHKQLEEELARFKKTESALFFTSGYMANVGIIPAICGRDDIVLSDKLNHASIIDGIILSRAEFKRYAHNDMDALKEILEGATHFGKRLIVTDTVFSMDGDCASLKEIVMLAKKYNAIVMVDEAHAFGVLGKQGMGLVEELGLEGQVDIQMGTFSKAAGSFGAYCCGSKALIDYLVNHARSLIYTTGLPAVVAAVSRKAVDIIVEEPQRREKLLRNAGWLRSNLKRLGFDTLQSQTPIIPVLVKDAGLANDFSHKLLEKGIFVQAIRPPTVAVNTARLRLTVMATHTQQDLDTFLKYAEDVGEQLGLI